MLPKFYSILSITNVNQCTESSIWTEGSGSNQVTYADARVWFTTEKYLISTSDKVLQLAPHLLMFVILTFWPRTECHYSQACTCSLLSYNCLHKRDQVSATTVLICRTWYQPSACRWRTGGPTNRLVHFSTCTVQRPTFNRHSFAPTLRLMLIG